MARPMPSALALLILAAALGAYLVACYLRRRSAGRAVRLSHAGFGIAGLGALLLSLQTSGPASQMGTAGFGPTAAVLVALALLLGLALARAFWQRRRPNELLVGFHAGLAIAGLVLLLALAGLG
jgi:hypothetical protein